MEAPAAIPPPENRPQSSRSSENRTSRSTDNVSSAHRMSENRSPSVRMMENRPSERRFSGSPEDRKPRSTEDVSPEYRSPENRSPSWRVPEGQPPEQRFWGSPEDRNQRSMENVSTASRSPENPSPSVRAQENRPSEQRFQGSQEGRNQGSTENVTMAYRLPENRPSELRFSALPEDGNQGSMENVSTAYRLPEKKPPIAIEDRQADRDDLALSPVMTANRSSRVEMGSVTKWDEGGDRRSRVVSSILLRSRMQAMIRKSVLWFRILETIFCLVSFSVMAADKTQGWSGDSFDRYKAYRFCISVTIIGFIYGGFQAYGQAHHLITGKYLIPYPLRCYFNFSMDQIFAYLLMSAASAAATRTDDWVTNWGHDEFTKMASASIGMAFLAFVTFAFSALISGYNLYNRNPLPQL